jgi:hypothetical protein
MILRGYFSTFAKVVRGLEILTFDRYGSKCHTTVRESLTEASICVTRMFNSHIQ